MNDPDMTLRQMRAMLAEGRVAEAAEAAHAVLAIAPDNGEAHALLGKLAAQQGDSYSALRHLDRAEQGGRSHDGDLAAARGIALARSGRYANAIEPLQQASTRGSDPLGSLLRLAWTFERLSRFDELRETLARARSLAANQGHDIRANEAILLARTPEWGEALATLDAIDTLAGENRLARGRLRDRAGRYDDAWRDFVEGKREIAQLQRVTYPAAAIAAHFDRLAAVFTAERIANLPRAEVRTGRPQPIFVAGAPRSGTTLAERLIASDPQIDARGELPFLGTTVGRLAAAIGAYPDALAQIDSGLIASAVVAVRDGYLDLCDGAGRGPTPRFVDKMPFNEQHLPLVTLAFPASPVVVMTRHPLDVVVSMMSHHLTHGYHCALSPSDAARHLAQVDRLAAGYEAAGCALSRVRYEDLVQDAGHGAARLAAAIGSSGLSDEAASGAVAATPSYAAVDRPIDRNAVARWRNYADHLRELVPMVIGIAERHGYDLA